MKMIPRNLYRPIFAHLNANLLEPKYEPLKALIKENVDILLVSETKPVDTFPNGQFKVGGHEKPIRQRQAWGVGSYLSYAMTYLV